MKSKSKKRKIILDIIVYLIVGISFLLALVGVILKFNNKSISLFGKSYDVVLTDSMSEKNPEWEEFLKGHDDQFQPFDIAISEKVNSEKDIDVYDIVIYDNPSIGKDMHRIVGKTQIGSDDITVRKGKVKTIDGRTGFGLDLLESDIVSNDIFVEEISLVVYSSDYYEDCRFNFTVAGTSYDPTMTKEELEGGYLTTYKILRSETKPGRLTIAHKYDYSFSNELILELDITNSTSSIALTTDNVVEEGENYVGSFNQRYKYEIRGDKAKTSDGEFEISKIQSKVVGRIPKLGILVRFLSSIWGMILFISLGVLLLAYDILSSRIAKKEEKSAVENQLTPLPSDPKKGEKDNEKDTSSDS